MQGHIYSTHFLLLQTLPKEEPVVITLDLSDLEALEGFIQKVHDICGHIDILINNGGISHRDSILNTTFEVDKKIMHVNYFGTVVLTKGIIAYLLHSIDLCIFWNVSGVIAHYNVNINVLNHMCSKIS